MYKARVENVKRNSKKYRSKSAMSARAPDCRLFGKCATGERWIAGGTRYWKAIFPQQCPTCWMHPPISVPIPHRTTCRVAGYAFNSSFFLLVGKTKRDIKIGMALSLVADEVLMRIEEISESIELKTNEKSSLNSVGVLMTSHRFKFYGFPVT